jgi:purine-binding chemotaxis protein CheW
MSVREIRGWTPTMTLPNSPSYVRGVVNLRGAVLPIIDLGARFGYPPTEPGARSAFLVVEIGSQLVGLLVDAVSDILTISPELAQATPDAASAATKQFVKAIIVTEGRMISLIALEAIVPAMEPLAA